MGGSWRGSGGVREGFWGCSEGYLDVLVERPVPRRGCSTVPTSSQRVPRGSWGSRSRSGPPDARFRSFLVVFGRFHPPMVILTPIRSLVYTCVQLVHTCVHRCSGAGEVHVHKCALVCTKCALLVSLHGFDTETGQKWSKRALLGVRTSHQGTSLATDTLLTQLLADQVL